MASHGPLFTWFNKREEGLIYKILDIVLINDAWSYSFPQVYFVFEAGGCSDHMRCYIQIDREVLKPIRPFKFTNALTSFSGFSHLMEDFWGETEECICRHLRYSDFQRS